MREYSTHYRYECTPCPSVVKQWAKEKPGVKAICPGQVQRIIAQRIIADGMKIMAIMASRNHTIAAAAATANTTSNSSTTTATTATTATTTR